MPIFSGSYASSDVDFLLREIELAPTPIAEKEALIQSGKAHYSEMISKEQRPDVRYMNIFRDSMVMGGPRIAREILLLARHIAFRIKSGLLNPVITLCSLVRAGIPYGVLLHRELLNMGFDSRHYGISIIRDRGLDRVAMAKIMDTRPVDGIVFVDGWTGKGAISRELHRSWKEISGRIPEFVVLADPSGYATYSGSQDDWLIPSGILGANISGLISRSILNPELCGPGQYHGTVRVLHLADIDMSRDFVDGITRLIKPMRNSDFPVIDFDGHADLRQASLECITGISRQYGVADLNRVKPGIAEATRAVLRRRPERVFLRNWTDPDLAALIYLCERDGIEMECSAEIVGPYRAVTLIARAGITGTGVGKC